MKKKLVTWDSRLVDFLSNYNTVLVKKEDIDKFISKMEKVGLDASRLKERAELIGDLLIEYNNNKGFTYWNMLDDNNPNKDDMKSAIKRSTEWFMIEPFSLEEIL